MNYHEIRGYQLGHIDWAIKVEGSGLCTQDYLDEQARLKDKPYLRDEAFQSDVERARRFIFDELPVLGGTEFRERLAYHLSNYTKNETQTRELFNEVMEILNNH